MFTEPTVFILGAGSSCDYEYPSGEKLVTDVIAEGKLFIQGTNNYLRSQHVSNLTKLKYVEFLKKKDSGLNDETASQKMLDQCSILIKKLQNINPPVIDHFLNYNSDISDIGKFIIAMVILKCERKFLKRSASARTDYFTGKDWHRFISFKTISNCKKSSDLLENKVQFITFNYDCSLEHSLWKSLSLTHNFTNEDKERFFSKSERFLHMYGQIRKDYTEEKITWPTGNQNLSWLSDNKDFFDSAYDSSIEIRTIYGEDKDHFSEIISHASEAIKAAKNIYILGYGFDEQNNIRLGLNENLRWGYENSRSVFFTNFGDRQVINKRASKIFFGDTSRFHPNDPFVIPSGSCIYEKSTRNVYDAIDQDFDFL